MTEEDEFFETIVLAYLNMQLENAFRSGVSRKTISRLESEVNKTIDQLMDKDET